jgi:hypothetical protein
VIHTSDINLKFLFLHEKGNNNITGKVDGSVNRKKHVRAA